MSAERAYRENEIANRIAVIDGQERVGTINQSSGGVNRKIRRSKTSESERAIIIKLPRDTLAACERECGRSLAFSHTEDIAGRRAVIYATGNKGGFHAAFEGDIEEVSHNGSRAYALVNTVEITRSRWNKEPVWRKLTK